MTKIEKTGAAPVSKYAAKKAARIAAAMEETTASNVTINGNAENKPSAEPTHVATATPSPIRKPEKGDLSSITSRFPDHMVQIALLMKNNAEIRRFTALGILNYLLQKGEIKGEKRYVSFKWNKFAVKADGLMREFSYNEPFFLNALVASFASFSASAQRIIDNFCRKEMSVGIAKAVDQDEVDNIVSLNEDYQDNNNTVITE